MKISEQTDRRLVLREGNLPAFLVGGLFVLMGVFWIVTGFGAAEKTPIWAPLVMIFVGLLILLAGRTTTLVFDKDTAKLSIGKKFIWGLKVKELELSRIKSVGVWAAYYTKNENRQDSLLLMLEDQEPMLVAQARSVSIFLMGAYLGRWRSRLEPLGERVAQFLGVPFEVKRPPKIGEVFSDIKTALKESVTEAAERHERRSDT